jgi:hypothetical protein
MKRRKEIFLKDFLIVLLTGKDYYDCNRRTLIIFVFDIVV